MQPLAASPALIDQVRDAIVDAIVTGNLRAGERLAQEDIARQLGVSRQPVSHALNVLKQQGVLVEFGRKGLTVASIEPERLRALYEVRASLDALAARTAGERVAAGAADPQVLASLESLVATGSRAPTGQTDIGRLVDADTDFHVTLYRLSGNPWLEEITQPQWIHFRRCMHAALEDHGLRGEVWPEHTAILQAVLAGDAERAGALAEQHARRAGKGTAERLAAPAIGMEDTS